MQPLTRTAFLIATLGGLTLAGCSDNTSSPGAAFTGPTSCSGISVDPQPAKTSPATLPVFGVGLDTTRYSAEIAVRGNIAYTTTWNVRRVQGNKINIWDVSGGCPQLSDSLIVTGVTTTGDIADQRRRKDARRRDRVQRRLDRDLRSHRSPAPAVPHAVWQRPDDARGAHRRDRPRERKALRVSGGRSESEWAFPRGS